MSTEKDKHNAFSATQITESYNRTRQMKIRYRQNNKMFTIEITFPTIFVKGGIVINCCNRSMSH